ncbi:MAG: hypothetical protein K0R92_21 [Lachnospiraceae bacterium]|jgi:hypothetical protein|nr:hypothetical protein [Anaerocolumna sp.]MDF2608547.1 hypothetical protein [Lachnospiraceae bacterium]
MKLLEAISILDINNRWLLKSVIKVVEARLDYLNYQEPHYEEELYHQWEERYKYLENALDAFYKAQLLLGTLDNNIETIHHNNIKDNVTEAISEGVLCLEHCQNEFGGLSRINVY